MNMPKLSEIPEGAHVKNRYSNILPSKFNCIAYYLLEHIKLAWENCVDSKTIQLIQVIIYSVCFYV